MRWRNFLIPTTKETPKDATAASHILMLRAGLIRQLAAGVYSYLPLGLRALHKVEKIVRAEMDRAGAIELRMPCLTPLSLWNETGRSVGMGDVLLRIAGPEGDWRSGLVLGPTHEEVITEIARAYLKSYKQMPCNLYQIQLKFRGEARPKSGVLRTREFLMKDAYSFHDTKESLDTEYDNMYRTYCRIFGRAGLPYLAVEADTGAMGGDTSHEFMVLTEAGEDQVALSADGKYAANLERAAAAPPAPADDVPLAPLREIHTPGVGSIEAVCKLLGTQPEQMVKTLIYTALVPAGHEQTARQQCLVVLVRGDHEVNEVKLHKVAGIALELATPAVISALTGAAVGFAGPQGLLERIDGLIIDREVTVLRNAITGANRTDYHVTGLNPGRDFPLTGEKVTVADVRCVVDGDFAPHGSVLHLRKAIEIGHVFKLGTKYSAALEATYLDPHGKAHPLIMGCYGIGLNRIMAAAVEAHHDEHGIIWPVSIAPFEALVIALDPRDEEVMRIASELHAGLEAAGVDVLFDDRDERAGFKFKDADLIGVPYRVVVGRKSLDAGGVELSRRRLPGERTIVPVADALSQVRAQIAAEHARLQESA
ncbi:MAG: proline--tRNA ligase [Phycisphaerales bacterium]|nr:proline--tRNA ligase [Phycisphaerales bacterium]